MIGKRRHEFMPKDDADWHEANDRQVIEAGRALEFEEYSQLKGRSITWLTTKFPLRDAQGRIYAVAGISADVSERKRAEEVLRESEERYRGVVENTTAIVLRVDPQGRHQLCQQPGAGVLRLHGGGADRQARRRHDRPRARKHGPRSCGNGRPDRGLPRQIPLERQ